MRATNWLKTLLIPVTIVLLVIASKLPPQERPECPHDWDFHTIRINDQKGVTLQTISGTQLSASGVQTNVPEFNDCQRLIIGTGKLARYDALYAVFAWDSTDLDTLGVKNLIDSGMALPLVEILSIGGTYKPLAILPGLSCLFVSKDHDIWDATLLYFGAVEQDCHSPRPVSELQSLPHANLAIKRTSYADLQWKDYPAVARWDWDVDSSLQVIGFKCLDGWCEVGKRGFLPNTGPDLTTTMSSVPSLAGTSILRVKGWYDQQRLAPTSPDWWRPGAGPRPVIGTIIPVSGLDQFDGDDDFRSRWQPIAYVNLSAPSAEYRAKQNFVPMTPTGSITTISLCVEHWAFGNLPPMVQRCPRIPDAVRQAARCAPEGAGLTKHWWARTIPAGDGPAKYWCIVRRPAPAGASVPGTARWRWLASDETTWGRCGGACCSGH